MVMISTATEQDGQPIQSITANTSVFTLEEADCVAELWEEYRQHGAQISGYYFVVESLDGHVRGYACYGPRSLTEGTYDLFWIAVDPEYRRAGVVVETSGLEKYAPTRHFYLATGYLLEATLKDFYKEGDDLVIFTKHL
jgi:GNAT superfamily N-acetyltransferase